MNVLCIVALQYPWLASITKINAKTNSCKQKYQTQYEWSCHRTVKTLFHYELMNWISGYSGGDAKWNISIIQTRELSTSSPGFLQQYICRSLYSRRIQTALLCTENTMSSGIREFRLVKNVLAPPCTAGIGFLENMHITSWRALFFNW